MDENEEVLEQLYWEFDSARNAGARSERDIFKGMVRWFACRRYEDGVSVAVTASGTKYYNPEEAYYRAEEHECAMMALDKAGVPRADKTGKEYSLFGRACWMRDFGTRMPWWRKGKDGWPIETWEGRPFKSAIRIVLQNIRKMIG